MIEFQGQTKTISAWARDLNIDPSTLRCRIGNGWPMEKALTMNNMDMNGRRERRDAHAKRKESISHAHHSRQPAKQALKVLGNLFHDDGMGRLWFGVLQCAVLDLYTRGEEREQAIAWLNGDMEVMQRAGINPEYIRLVLKQAGIRI